MLQSAIKNINLKRLFILTGVVEERQRDAQINFEVV